MHLYSHQGAAIAARHPAVAIGHQVQHKRRLLTQVLNDVQAVDMQSCLALLVVLHLDVSKARLYLLRTHMHPHTHTQVDGLPGAAAATSARLAGNGATGSMHATVSALFCRYDLPQLERVVGGARARKMISGESATYMFC